MLWRDTSVNIVTKKVGNRLLDNAGNWRFEFRGNRIYDTAGNWRYAMRGDRLYDTAGNWLGSEY